MAIDDNRRHRVHAGTIVTDMPPDLDMHGRREPDRDGVGAVRVHHLPMMFIVPRTDPMQPLVQFPNRTLREIHLDHWRCQE